MTMEADADRSDNTRSGEKTTMRKTLIPLLLLFVAVVASAQDPAAALAQGREHIAAKRYAEAATVLEGGVVGAGQISDENIRTQALSAIHFYAAVAHSGAGNDARTREHLREYFRANPTARVDPAKYDKKFVAAFNDMSKVMSGAAKEDSFDKLYPGFRTYVGPALDASPDTWGTTHPALEVLGTRAEKRTWGNLTNTADRAKFIADFWAKRDTDPATPQNEFQVAYERRAAFSDKMFAVSQKRGAYDDRGRVFSILGEPIFVRRRPISDKDKMVVAIDVMINGVIEQWTYSKDQLPVALQKPTITYRFVTQQGIGENVLQRQEDAFAMQALQVAANPSGK